MKRMVIGFLMAATAFVAQADEAWLPSGVLVGVSVAANGQAALVGALPYEIGENDPALACAFFTNEGYFAYFDPTTATGQAIMTTLQMAADHNMQLDANIETDTCTVIDVAVFTGYTVP